MAYDKQRAREVIEFIQMLKLTDDFYGKPFVLQGWQTEVLEAVYGTVKVITTKHLTFMRKA